MKKEFAVRLRKSVFFALIAFFILASVIACAFKFGKTNVAAAATTSTWDGSSSDTSFDGEGTKEKPYLITSAAELNGLRVNTNAGNTYSGVYFKLTVDIDLNSKNWGPIGYKAGEFKGYFDGDGHTVSNLSANVYGCPAGLFGCVEGGSISNLGIVGGTVTRANDNYSDTIYPYAGAIAGYIGGGTTVTNCYNSGCEVNGAVAGGIVGYNGNDAFAPIVNCYNTGIICSQTDASGANTDSSSGGIVGYSKTTSGKRLVINCYNTGKVIGVGSKGGLIGEGETLAKNSYYYQEAYQEADSYSTMLESGSLTAASSISTSDSFTSASSTVTYKESASSEEEELTLVDALNKGAILYNADSPTVAAKAWTSVSGGYPVLALTSAETYSVTHTLDGLTVSGTSEATGGSDYSATLTAANPGRTLPSSITVTVGGTKITLGSGYSYSTNTGTVTIPAENVTGDIVIIATAGKLTGEGSDGKYYLDGVEHTHDFSGETGICACKLYSNDGGTTIFSPLSADGLQTLLLSNSSYIPNGNYYLTENVTLSQAVKIKNGVKVNLALNGKTYDLSGKYITVESGGSLTVLDKDRAGLIMANNSYYCIVNKGTLTVDDARVTGSSTKENDQGVIVNNDGATATITNSTVTNESTGYAVNNVSGATLLSIGDSTVASEHCGIYHQSNSTEMYLYGDSIINGKDYDIYLTTSIWAISKDGMKSYTGDDTITIKFKDTVSDGQYIVCNVTADNKGKFLPMFDEDDLKNIDEAIVIKEGRDAYGDVLMTHKHNYKTGVCASCGNNLTGLDGDGKYYVDGELGTGVYDDKYYKDGVLATGTVDGVYYVDGNPANGVTDGKYYKDGVLATGTADGVYYVNGDPANGVTDGKYYKDGVLATGTADGVYYVDGSPANGEYGDKYYENGTPFNGTHEGKYYKDGVIFSGVDNNKYYENGVLATGTADGVYYVDGSPANGEYDGKYYKDGTPFTGKDGDAYYVDGEIHSTHTYTNGVCVCGEHETYYVYYTTNGGVIRTGLIESYTHGSGAFLPTNVTKTGCKFIGWYLSGDESETIVTVINADETGDKTFVAKWEEKKTVSIDQTAQTYTYNPDVISRTFTVKPETGMPTSGYTVKYYVNEKWTSDAPKNASSYNVKVTRSEDSDYKALSVEIADGLVIEKAMPKVDIVSESYGVTLYTSSSFPNLSDNSMSGGTVKWNDGQTLTAGTKSYAWTFTPTDTDNYNIVTGTIELTVLEVVIKEIEITQ